MRIEYIGEKYPQEIWDRGDNLILAFWHDQLFLMAPGYKKPQPKNKIEIRVLISQLKDGELIARTMEFFGIGVVCGFSNCGGREVLCEMVNMG